MAALNEDIISFASIDDFIESLIPDDGDTCSNDSFEHLVSTEFNDIDKLYDVPNTVNVIGDILAPMNDIMTEANSLDMLNHSFDETIVHRQFSRSASTSTVVSSPPLSPASLDGNQTAKIEEGVQSPLPLQTEFTFGQGAFTPWELQQPCNKKYRYDPKPLLRKGQRQSVPDQEKNNKYWQRRNRNNKAARKSREDRRQKELEVLQKMHMLQDENKNLKLCMNSVVKANEQLQQSIIHMRQQLELAGFFSPVAPSSSSS